MTRGLLVSDRCTYMTQDSDHPDIYSTIPDRQTLARLGLLCHLSSLASRNTWCTPDTYFDVRVTATPSQCSLSAHQAIVQLGMHVDRDVPRIALGGWTRDSLFITLVTATDIRNWLLHNNASCLSLWSWTTMQGICCRWNLRLLWARDISWGHSVTLH